MQRSVKSNCNRYMRIESESESEEGNDLAVIWQCSFEECTMVCSSDDDEYNLKQMNKNQTAYNLFSN